MRMDHVVTFPASLVSDREGSFGVFQLGAMPREINCLDIVPQGSQLFDLFITKAPELSFPNRGYMAVTTSIFKHISAPTYGSKRMRLLPRHLGRGARTSAAEVSQTVVPYGLPYWKSENNSQLLRDRAIPFS